jgi:hypothetical protein
MSDCLKGANPFLERIPTELQEKYFTDYMTEILNLVMAEGYNINDSGIPFKYGIIIAFARKT